MRLAALLRYLDRCLDQRPEVVRGDGYRTVWVFGALGYRVDSRLRAVYPVRRDADGAVVAAEYTMELFRPLATQNFLPFVVRRLGLSDFGPQRHLFRKPVTIAGEEYRISQEAYRQLLRDPRFRELRERHLPRALALDPVLCGITLASRREIRSRIASDHYSLVWQHEQTLRQAARECPWMLPLVVTALDEGWIDPVGDVVHQLSQAFREEELQPATWRYLVHHGTRFLRPVWRRTDRGHRMRAVVEFLRELERAGHPAPPPSWAISAWLGFRVGHPARMDPGWNPIPPEVSRIAMLEAKRVRGTLQEFLLHEDLRLVFTWASRELPRLDKLQRRAGWAWLLRQGSAQEKRRLLLQTAEPKSWPFAIGAVESREFRATPVDTVEGSVEEGMGFHNCIAGYVEECQEGVVRIFVVKERISGRRLAVVRLDWREVSGWVLQGVLGVANTPVGDKTKAFALHLLGRYQAHAGRGVLSGPCFALKPRSLLAALDVD